MSMSDMNLYSAESWSISTALCVLSGNFEISSSSTIVWNDRCWAPGHGDYPVVSSRPSDLRQKRPDDREYWAGDVLLLSRPCPDYGDLDASGLHISLVTLAAVSNKNLAIANRSRVSCISTNNNIMTLKSGLEVTQCHWMWCHSKV